VTAVALRTAINRREIPAVSNHHVPVDVMQIIDGRVEEALPWAAEMEEAGFGRLWVGDSPGLGWADPYLAMASLSGVTTRVGLGTGVTNPVTRHWSAVAGAMATVQELSGGRAVFGIGLGYSAVKAVGLRPAKVDELRQFVDNFRTATAKVGCEVPVVVAASGPRALSLAGEIGDGVLLSVGTHPALIRQALEQVEVGARAAGRSLADLEVLALSGLAISDDWEVARVEGAPAAARRALDILHNDKALPSELADLVEDARSVAEVYDVNLHTNPGDTEQNKRVSDRLVRAYTLVGDADACLVRAEEMRAAGVDTIVLYPVGRHRREMVRSFGESVLPRLDGAPAGT
jgi:5,10-methylenetetrahydromethanopterin reductase